MFLLSGGVLFYFIFVSPPYSTRLSAAPPISLEAAAAMARRRVRPFTSSLWLRPFIVHLDSTHTHCTVYIKTHKHSASEGSGKVRYSDEGQSKNTHHVFLERQRARRCLSALLPLNKCRQKGAAHCGGFPSGRARWLGKKDWVWRFKLKPLRLESLLNKSLLNSCALEHFIYLQSDRYSLCGGHQRELMRIES